MCVSLVALTTYPSITDGTGGVQLTVTAITVLLTRTGEEEIRGLYIHHVAIVVKILTSYLISYDILNFLLLVFTLSV